MNRTKRFVMIVIAFGLVSVAFQGCVIMPVPASGEKVTYGARIKKEDVAFVKLGVTTRPEVTQRFGAPAESYAEPKVVVYWWARVVGYWGFLVPCGPGLDVGANEIERNEMLLVQFDEKELVRKVAFKRMPTSGTLEGFVTNWADRSGP